MQEIVLFSHWLFKLALQLLRGDFILLKYIRCLLSKHVILFILSGFFFFLQLKNWYIWEVIRTH